MQHSNRSAIKCAWVGMLGNVGRWSFGSALITAPEPVTCDREPRSPVRRSSSVQKKHTCSGVSDRTALTIG